MHLDESAADLGKELVGEQELRRPGRQGEFEAEYTRPFYRKIAMDYGYMPGIGEFDVDQLKRRLAEQPAHVAMDAIFLANLLGLPHGKVGLLIDLLHLADIVNKSKPPSPE